MWGVCVSDSSYFGLWLILHSIPNQSNEEKICFVSKIPQVMKKEDEILFGYINFELILSNYGKFG